jgi:DNA invertase Pin-like site-specific DNA recombinase
MPNFTDHASGSKASRPELDRMLDQLRFGDVVVVWRLDRLPSRTSSLLLNNLNMGVGFRSLSESIDTTTANGRLFFSIMAALAEFERDLIQERTKAGLLAARVRGRAGGPSFCDEPEKDRKCPQALRL